MALPPLYKYLNVDGAKKTLGTKCFRHAKPSSFNDLEDMTVGTIFAEDVEVAAAKLGESAFDILAKHKNRAAQSWPKK
jgi:hypothetical protein